MLDWLHPDPPNNDDAKHLRAEEAPKTVIASAPS